MTSSSRRRGLAFGLVGALALATPAFAGPVLTSTTGVKAAVQDNVVDVRWRHRGGGAGVAAGLAFGALAGAAIGAATAPRYYGYSGYPAYYGYSYPSYGYTYPSYGYTYPAYGAYTAQGPVVYGGPAYGYTYGSSYAYPAQTCGVYGGYGRWDYSQC
jgi:hypothetical protein